MLRLCCVDGVIVYIAELESTWRTLYVIIDPNINRIEYLIAKRIYQISHPVTYYYYYYVSSML